MRKFCVFVILFLPLALTFAQAPENGKTPDGIFTASPSNGCVPLNVKFSLSENADFEPVWDLDEAQMSIRGPSEFSHTFDQPGLYNVSLKAKMKDGSLRLVESQLIYVADSSRIPPSYSIPGNRKYAYPGEKISFGNPDPDAITTFWDFGDRNVSFERNPDFAFGEEGIYQVRLVIINQEGCPGRFDLPPLQVKNESSKILFPQMFSPNQDGINDCFKADVLEGEKFFISVFDRFGNTLFESRDPSFCWEGKNRNGKQLPEGTYFYTARLQAEKFSGNISLLR